MQNSKKGFGTLVSLILIIGLLPIMLFVSVDVPYHMQYHKKMKSIVNEISAGSITRLNETELAKGNLVLDYALTRSTVFSLVEQWFSLEPVLYPVIGQPDYVFGMKRIVKNEGDTVKMDSILDKDPLVVEIGKLTTPIRDAKLLTSTRIEFFIHNGHDTFTYHFMDGTPYTVSTPTVAVMVYSKSPGVIFKIPMNVTKVGISEVALDTRYGD